MFMAEWWEALTTLQHIFIYTAVPFTVVLIIQAILTIIGLGGDHDASLDSHDIGDHDTGFDGHADGHIDGHAEHEAGNEEVGGFQFFTVRGIVAFFCIFGWTGYALDPSLGIAVTLLISTAAGLLAMFVIGLMFYAVRRMQSSGNLRYSNAIGRSAEVYIPVPAQRGGRGKVMVEIQERLVEAEAVTDEGEKLKTGETVKVIGNIGSTLIIKR
jgi:membrane protein implicated in regulation of membrane protease activity